jgi:hypothetical protein
MFREIDPIEVMFKAKDRDRAQEDSLKGEIRKREIQDWELVDKIRMFLLLHV